MTKVELKDRAEAERTLRDKRRESRYSGFCKNDRLVWLYWALSYSCQGLNGRAIDWMHYYSYSYGVPSKGDLYAASKFYVTYKDRLNLEEVPNRVLAIKRIVDACMDDLIMEHI